jgi:preprotein translocase subunit Sec61beta
VYRTHFGHVCICLYSCAYRIATAVVGLVFFLDSLRIASIMVGPHFILKICTAVAGTTILLPRLKY